MSEEYESNSAFIKALDKIRHEKSADFSRREKAHIAILNFEIEVKPVNLDNTMEDSSLNNKDFSRYNMSNKAKIIIKGSSEADCVKKVKQALEKVNDSSGRTN